MNYLVLKHVHVSCVVLSGLGFVLRGGWMLIDSPRLHARLSHLLPHLLDSLLFGSALSMAYLSGQYPFVDKWLTAKFFALLVYILLGTVALKRGKTKLLRATAFLFALLAYAYLIAVAVNRSPWPY